MARRPFQPDMEQAKASALAERGRSQQVAGTWSVCLLRRDWIGLHLLEKLSDCCSAICRKPIRMRQTILRALKVRLKHRRISFSYDLK